MTYENSAGKVLREAEVNDSSRTDDDRRGRFWTWLGSTQSFTDKTGKVQEGAEKAVKGKGFEDSVKSKFGFQFLWNPETWSSNVQINPDVTPNTPQYWGTALPVFPSGQNMSFNIVVDRVNDFACFGATPLMPSISSLPAGKPPTSWLDTANTANIVAATAAKEAVDKFQQFYVGGDIKNKEAKILDLMKRGTLADIEYIYKTCNGDKWVRLDQATSDIGFLMMTLVEVEIGPNRYLGYLNSLGIEHTMFTEAMTPIRSNVSLQFVLMASARVASTKPL